MVGALTVFILAFCWESCGEVSFWNGEGAIVASPLEAGSDQSPHSVESSFVWLGKTFEASPAEGPPATSQTPFVFCDFWGNGSQSTMEMYLRSYGQALRKILRTVWVGMGLHGDIVHYAMAAKARGDMDETATIPSEEITQTAGQQRSRQVPRSRSPTSLESQRPRQRPGQRRGQARGWEGKAFLCRGCQAHNGSTAQAAYHNECDYTKAITAVLFDDKCRKTAVGGPDENIGHYEGDTAAGNTGALREVPAYFGAGQFEGAAQGGDAPVHIAKAAYTYSNHQVGLFSSLAGVLSVLNGHRETAGRGAGQAASGFRRGGGGMVAGLGKGLSGPCQIGKWSTVSRHRRRGGPARRGGRHDRLDHPDGDRADCAPPTTLGRGAKASVSPARATVQCGTTLGASHQSKGRLAHSAPTQQWRRTSKDQGNRTRQSRKQAGRRWRSPWLGLYVSFTGSYRPIDVGQCNWLTHSITFSSDFTNPWYASCLGTQLAFEVSLMPMGLDTYHTYMQDLRGQDCNEPELPCDPSPKHLDYGDQVLPAWDAAEDLNVNIVNVTERTSHMPPGFVFSATAAGRVPPLLVHICSSKKQAKGQLSLHRHLVPFRVGFADATSAAKTQLHNAWAGQVNEIACDLTDCLGASRPHCTELQILPSVRPNLEACTLAPQSRHVRLTTGACTALVPAKPATTGWPCILPRLLGCNHQANHEMYKVGSTSSLASMSPLVPGQRRSKTQITNDMHQVLSSTTDMMFKGGSPSSLASLSHAQPLPFLDRSTQWPALAPAGDTKRAAKGSPPLLSQIFAQQAALFPGFLDSEIANRRPREVAALQPASDEPTAEPRYDLFDPIDDRRTRPAGVTWTIHEYAVDATRAVAFLPKSIHFLTVPLPSTMLPNIVLSPARGGIGSRAIPFDLREVGGNIATVVVSPHEAVADILVQLRSKGHDLSGSLASGLNAGTLGVFDCRGYRIDHVTEAPDVQQWLAARWIQDVPPVLRERTTGTTTWMQPASPPMLLGQVTGFSPDELPLHLHSVQLIPEGLRQAYSSRVPAAQLRLFAQLDPASAGTKPVSFSLLMRGFPPARLQGAARWSLIDFVSDAVHQCDQTPVRAQVLTTSLAGFDEPQVVVTEQSDCDAPGACVIPVDFRGFRGEVIPIVVSPGMNIEAVLQAAIAFVPVATTLLTESAAGELFMQDAQGQVYDVLPASLLHLQWLVLRRRTEAPFLQPLLEQPPTTTTVTYMLPSGHADPRTVQFLMVGDGTTVRLTEVPYALADPQIAILELLKALTRLGRLQTDFTIQMAPVFPRTSAATRYIVPFLYVPQNRQGTPDAPTITVIYDPGVDGAQIYAMTLPEGARPSEILSDVQKRSGAQIFVNGVHSNACSRPLVTGDLIQQLGEGRWPGVARNAGPLLDDISRLRCLSFPINLPALGLFIGPQGTLVAPRVGIRSIEERLEDAFELRLDQLGRPARTSKRITVFQPGRAPHIFWINTPLTPTVYEACELLETTGLFTSDMVLVDVAPSVELRGADAFLALPAEVPWVTLTVSDPFAVCYYLLVHFPAGARPPWDFLPLRSGMTFKPVPVLANGAHIGSTRAASGHPSSSGSRPSTPPPPQAPSRPSRPSSDGTSLVQLTLPAARRKQIIFDNTPEAARAAAIAASVPTPFGRRRVTVPCKPCNVPDAASLPTPLGATTPALQLSLAQHLPQSAALPSATVAPRDQPEASHIKLAPTVVPLSAWASCWEARLPFIPTGKAYDAVALRHPPGAWAPVALHVYTDGSAFPGSPLGWATAVFEECVDRGCTWLNFLGYFSGKAQPFAARGLCAAEHNVDAEAVALSVATAWALSWPGHVPVHIWCDCRAAVDIAAGHASPQVQCTTKHLWKACRCMWQALERRPSPAQLHWIPSHSGYAANELVDQLAKFACHNDSMSVPPELFTFLAHDALEWLWHVLAPSPGLPPFQVLAAGVYEKPDVVPADCLPAAATKDVRTRASCGRLGLCSYNAQTLKFKKDLLRQQMTNRSVHILFLQETRMSAGTCSAEDFLEVRGPCTKGNLGCALWVARSSPAGAVDKNSVRTLYADERLLIARLDAPHLKCYLVSAHAPHTGHSEAQCEAWWLHLDKQCRHNCSASLPLYIGLDANGQVGSRTSCAIGSHAPDEETPNGCRFHEFCIGHALCAPATFASANGQMLEKDPHAYTWVSPKQTKHRIDYVLVPAEQHELVQECSVFHDFETAGADDHFPTCVRVHVTAVQAPAPAVHFPRLPLRTVEAVREAGSQVPAILRCAIHTPWSTNVHRHVKQLDDELWKIRGHACPSRPRRPYITDEAWRHIRARKSCTAEIKHAAASGTRAVLLLAQRQWAFASGLRATPPDRRRLMAQSAAASQRIARAKMERHCLLAELRKALAKGKAAYIESQARKYEEAVGVADARALYQALRFFRPAGKKVFKAFEPLAVLRNDAGDAVQTFQEQQQLHRAHFAKQEAGHLITPQDYLALPEPAKADGDYALHMLPSLSDVERVIREAKDGKAPGPSGIPICVWKAYPTLSAEALLQVFTKAHVRLTEPIQYRCTKLTALFKKIGLAVKAESFRSIALLDPSAKMLHKLQRPRLLDELSKQAHPLQQGCLPGSVPTALTHLLVTNMRIALARKQSFGILFLDLTAAYYRLLRQAITGEDVQDEVLCQLLSRLQVPVQYVQDVAAFATRGNLLPDATPHLRRVLASTFRHTFFVLDGIDSLTYTQVGTRPGDSVSDVLFSLALASVVDEVRGVLGSQGMPDVAMPIWADDLSLPIALPAPHLLDAVVATTTALHHACNKRAMCPNYSEGKTEALVAYAGEGARAASRALFSTGQGKVPLPVSPETNLRCVLQYKHLGTTVSARCRPRRDVQQKLGFAKGVASTLAKKVLRRTTVNIKHRATILDVLAMSRAHYGIAIWGDFTAQEEAAWQAGHGLLYKSLLRPERGPDGPRFPTVLKICAEIGRPTPALTLRLLRLEHLRLIAVQQQEALIEALQLEAATAANSWWDRAEKDVLWLNQLIGRPGEGSTYNGVQGFIDDALHFPGKVKGVLKRAKARAATLHPVSVDGQVQAGAPAPETVAVTLPFLCSCCDKAFPDLHLLRAHMWARHRQVTFLAQCAPQDTCSACLTRFWTKPRLLRHIIHDSPHCGHLILARLHRRNCGSATTTVSRDTLPPGATCRRSASQAPC